MVVGFGCVLPSEGQAKLFLGSKDPLEPASVIQIDRVSASIGAVWPRFLVRRCFRFTTMSPADIVTI